MVDLNAVHVYNRNCMGVEKAGIAFNIILGFAKGQL